MLKIIRINKKTVDYNTMQHYTFKNETMHIFRSTAKTALELLYFMVNERNL